MARWLRIAAAHLWRLLPREGLLSSKTTHGMHRLSLARVSRRAPMLIITSLNPHPSSTRGFPRSQSFRDTEHASSIRLEPLHTSPHFL